MGAKKIAYLGAGSLYFKGALAELLINKHLSGSEITLYDLDHEKSKRMAAMGRRLNDDAGNGFKIRAAQNLTDTVDSADFVVISIGGSGADITRNVYDSYYHNADIMIPAKHGIHQIIGDTCGPAAMMMAFRSIPAYIRICREMEKHCPNAFVFSHSNPMAVLCRAMHKYSFMNVMGICHGVQIGIREAAKVLGVPACELECIWIGTNHYYWFTRVRYHGKDVYPELKKRASAMETPHGQQLTAKLSGIYGFRIVYPEDDHIIEFYPFLSNVPGGFGSLPYGMKPWGQIQKFGGEVPAVPVREKVTKEVRGKFFKGYQALLDEAKLSARHKSVGNEGMSAAIDAISTGRREVVIVNIANQGAISNLPATGEVELEAVTDSCGVRPIHIGEAPLALKGILEKRFVWHELVVDAAVKGDRNLALQALMMDEMAILPEKAEAMLDELLVASKELLPNFFK